MSGLGKYLRAVQSRFPNLVEAKYLFQKSFRKLLKIPFEKDFTIFEKLEFEDGQLILDIGANRGQSIDAIRMFHSHVSIRSFEPNKFLADKLTNNYKSDKNVKIFQYGLGDKTTSGELFTPFYYGFMYDGLSSFDFDEAYNWLNSETVAWFNDKKLEVKKAKCSIVRLDDLNLAPAFIKIDVQGFEKNVLLGAVNTLEKYKPLIMFEINEPAEQYLKSLGWLQCTFQNGFLNNEIHRNGDNVFFYHPDMKSKYNNLIIN